MKKAYKNEQIAKDIDLLMVPCKLEWTSKNPEASLIDEEGEWEGQLFNIAHDPSTNNLELLFRDGANFIISLERSNAVARPIQ